MDPSVENVDLEVVPGCEGYPDSGDDDEDAVDSQVLHDQCETKNRSKRKPSKTQIKHIAPSKGIDNQTKSKDESSNRDHSVDHMRDALLLKTSHSDTNCSQDVTSNSNARSGAGQPSNSLPSKQTKKTALHASDSQTGQQSNSSKMSPSYPCGICGKVFRVPSRYDSHMLGHSKGKPFCCTTCGKMFVSQEKLDQHMPVHSTDRKASFTCEICNKVCVNWRAYLYHLKAKHTASGGKKFACTICGRQFHTGQRLRNHMASHEIGKNHCCHICGKLFESAKKLDTHQLVHQLTSIHNQNLQCPDCGRQYTEWIAFKQHMKTHGAEGVQYPCGLCDEVFPTQYEKEKHKRVHKQVQCEFCDRYFRSASVLSVHLRIHTGERPYKCGLCERDFSQSAVLKVHMRTHKNEGSYACKLCGNVYHDVMEYFKHHLAHLEEGNLQCEECGKIFESIKSKNRHMAAHRDRAGRICHICGKEFGRVSHLEAHMLCHADQLPLMCKVCGKMFESEDAVNAHHATHTSEGDTSSEVTFPAPTKGPLYCGLCGKMFRGQAFLKKHMKRHEREGLDSRGNNDAHDEEAVEVDGGEFACTDCGKTFSQRHHLNVHRRDHTGERPHTCILCGQSFKLRTFLLDHIAEHRRDGFMMYSGPNRVDEKMKRDKTSKSKYKNAVSQNGKHGSETETDPEDDHNISHNNHVYNKDHHHHRLSTDIASHVPYHHMSDNSVPVDSSSDNNHNFTGRTDHNFIHRPDELTSTSNTTHDQFNKNSSIYDNIAYLSSLASAYRDHPQLSNSDLMQSEKACFNNPNNYLHTHGDQVFRNYSKSPEHNLIDQYNENGAVYQLEKLRDMKSTQSIDSSNGHINAKDIARTSYVPSSSQHVMSAAGEVSPIIEQSSETLHSLQTLQNFDRTHEEMPPGHSQTEPKDHFESHTIHRLEASNSQNQIFEDYRNDNLFSLPYHRPYLSPGVGNFQLRGSFYSGFPGGATRVPTESLHPVSSFQLLPQTAFPENSHQT